MIKYILSTITYLILNLCISINIGFSQNNSKEIGDAELFTDTFISFINPISSNISLKDELKSIVNGNESLISTLSVSVEIQHEMPSDLEIILNGPNSLSVILHRFGDNNIIESTIPYTTSNTERLKDYVGGNVINTISNNDEWTLTISDKVDNGINGTAIYWEIKFGIQDSVLFDSSIFDTEYPFLDLQLDGYGSFGDQGNGSKAGAIYQPIPEINEDNTVFHSVLYLHDEQRFLSTYDMYPGGPSFNVSSFQSDENNRINNTFNTNKANVLLNQELITSASHDFTLVQEYLLSFKEQLTEPYYITRYVNSKLNDIQNINDDSNYPAINKDINSNFKSITIFNEFINSITEETTFLEIGIDNKTDDNSVLFGYQIQEWKQNNVEFPDLIHISQNKGLNIYGNNLFGNLHSDIDSNFDGITDPGKGFDAALLIGIEIPAGVKEATFSTFTTWGYSSLSEVLQLPTLTNTPNITSTPTPISINTPTATSTPIPTNTFTQTPTFTSTNTPIPTSIETNTPTAIPTPTNVNKKPEWVKRIPDLRFIQNKSVEHILNLDEYVYDPDTPTSLIDYSIVKPNNLPLVLRDRSILSFGDVVVPQDYGFVTIQASDGYTTIAQNIRVKVSSLLTKSYYQIPPIVLQPGEAYFSPFSLDDFVLDKIGDETIDWSINNTISSIDLIELTDDNHIILQAANSASTTPQKLSFIAQRGDLPTNTPTFTPIPTATLTPTETATPTQTPTQTVTPTATSTVVPSSTPMPTSTNTATALPTFTNTATPTRTPTARRTLVPSVTPTPSPTPTLGCSLAFNFNAFNSSPVMSGPVEIVDGSTNTDHLYITHLDDGSVSIYDSTNNGLQETGSIQTQFGSTNTVLAELNNDGTPDAIVFNVLEEQIELYISTQNGGYQQSGLFDLNAENVPTLDALLNGYRYRGMSLESSTTNSAIIVLRTLSEILRIRVQTGESPFTVISRTAINGSIRFIQSADVDNDGDRDVIAAVNTTTGEENLLVYGLENNTLTLQNTIRIDTDFEGNFARDVIIQDFNHDGFPDFGLLTFSDAIRIYGRNENGSYSLLNESNPFSPGAVVGMDAGDLDGNGSFEIVALHEDQNGLNLYVICGNSPLQYTERIINRIQDFVLQGQDYHLRLLDLDEDRDEDILFTRSFFDDVITVENLSQP